MEQFTLRVTPEKLRAAACRFDDSAVSVKLITDTMLRIVHSTGYSWNDRTARLYRQKFDGLDDDMQKLYRMVHEHACDLKQMAVNYNTAEETNVARFNALSEAPLTAGLLSGAVLDAEQNAGTDGGFGGSGSVLSGSVGGGNNVVSGSVSGSFLGYSYDTTGKSSIKWKQDENGNYNLEDAAIGIGIKGNVYGAEGSAEGSIGPLAGSITGTLLTVTGTAEGKFTIFDDGVFAPSLGAEAKVEGAVLKGEAEALLGSDNNNIHINGEGKLLDGEATAEVKLGTITSKGDDGEVTTKYGFEAEVGAKAYAASGKISGGFTLLGIDFNVGLTGHAGGVSASAAMSVTTGGFSSSVDVGLLAGLGLDVSIDWSDFKFGW